MPKKLESNFVKIATSGPTIDGREISENDINEMAETYDPNEYTANIWYEHIRYFGNFGQVSDVKAGDDEKGRRCLFAKICPVAELLELNRNGQKLFTSIEIQPNFAGTGKAYLAGLAVTDSPASVGTSELQFSNRAIKEGNLFTRPEEFEQFDVQEKDESVFKRLFRNRSQKNSPSDDTDQDENTMKPEQLLAFTNALAAIQDNQTAMAEQFSDLKTAIDTKAKPEESDTGGDEEQHFTAESFNQLSNVVEELQKSVTDLSEKFSKAVKEPSGNTDAGENEGGLESENECI
ncbi:MAG: GPO family capsid scaffolding protein [Cellvibrionaceae bacterium]